MKASIDSKRSSYNESETPPIPPFLFAVHFLFRFPYMSPLQPLKFFTSPYTTLVVSVPSPEVPRSTYVMHQDIKVKFSTAAAKIPGGDTLDTR